MQVELLALSNMILGNSIVTTVDEGARMQVGQNRVIIVGILGIKEIACR